MRVDTNDWSVTSAVKMGYHHLYKGANCQDEADFFASDEIICGIGCDGCGSGDHSEVGARMLCNFALSEVARLHQMGYSEQRIVDTLFASLMRFIEMQIYLACPSADTPEQIAHYIKHHWLATVMGFIIREQPRHEDGPQVHHGVIFHCGDGVYAIDDEVVSIDQGNVPTYVAYHALREPHKVGVTEDVLPYCFTTAEFDATDIHRIMIASDGFEHHHEHKLALSRQKHSGLATSLHGQQWGKKGQVGLKKWMNSRFDLGFFDDDCFIITAERMNAEGDNS